MKFVYHYRTSDNTQHEGIVSAASRDAAYVVLKEKGIRPSRVDEAPGFFNKLFGKGKRWIAIVALLVLAVISLTYALNARREVFGSLQSPVDRHQIYGEPALMQELESENYASVFSDPGDRYLARFAQPGVQVKFKDRNWRSKMAEVLKDTLNVEIVVFESDSREVRELKQIVLGMRNELSEYLANGVGTCETFVKRMEERQLREYQIYMQAKMELSKETEQYVFDLRNASLRRLGLPTISMPNE